MCPKSLLPSPSSLLAALALLAVGCAPGVPDSAEDAERIDAQARGLEDDGRFDVDDDRFDIDPDDRHRFRRLRNGSFTKRAMGGQEGEPIFSDGLGAGAPAQPAPPEEDEADADPDDDLASPEPGTDEDTGDTGLVDTGL